MYKLAFLFGLVLLMTVSLDYSLGMISPISHDIENNSHIYVGKIGPGQTIGVDINGHVSKGGIYGQGGSYDLAVITDKPPEWKSEDSKLYGRPLHITITAPRDAQIGEYPVEVTLINYKNSEKLGNITMTLYVNISWDVLNAVVTPLTQKVGVNQPSKIITYVTNTGNAPDTFNIKIGDTSMGDRAYETTVYIPPQKTKHVVWEQTWGNPERYSFPISVTSTSSPKIISKSYNATIDVVPRNLLSDYKASTRGIVIFPIFDNVIYGLAALLGSII